MLVVIVPLPCTKGVFIVFSSLVCSQVTKGGGHPPVPYVYPPMQTVVSVIVCVSVVCFLDQNNHCSVSYQESLFHVILCAHIFLAQARSSISMIRRSSIESNLPLVFII
ncbi:unnamed protein product [Pylaiella littoralis]